MYLSQIQKSITQSLNTHRWRHPLQGTLSGDVAHENPLYQMGGVVPKNVSDEIDGDDDDDEEFVIVENVESQNEKGISNISMFSIFSIFLYFYISISCFHFQFYSIYISPWYFFSQLHQLYFTGLRQDNIHRHMTYNNTKAINNHTDI